MIHFINEKAIPGSGKISREGINGKKKIVALGASAMAVVMLLTGCGSDKVDSQTSAPTSETSSEATTEIEQRIDELQARVEELESTGITNIGANDTYSVDAWELFVQDALKNVNGKINSNDEVKFELALSVLNIDYLDQYGQKVLLKEFDRGTDVEMILNAQYGISSQIREWNTGLTSTDNYISHTGLLLDATDKEIISQLEELAKEVITLRQNPTAENKARIQQIFDMVYAFINGEGTIDMTIGGQTKAVGELDLTDGAIFASENIAQTISVLSKDIVSQDKRETMDGKLRSYDILAKVQESIIRYQTIATLDGVDTEIQERIYADYEKSFEIIKGELSIMSVTEEEAKALYTVTNADFFMDSLESQDVFKLIYKDGFDIREVFNLADSAIEKIVKYNDTRTSANDLYDMGRLVFASQSDYVSLSGYFNNLYNVNSKDSTIAGAAVDIIKGYNQYSSEVTIDYQTYDDEGNVINNSLDKNALSKGATYVINRGTLYSVKSHASVYGTKADAIIPLVDGSQSALDPYDHLVLAFDGYCADKNILVYGRYVDESTQGQK